MALTLNVDPAHYCLSKSPMWAKITTDKYVVSSGAKAVFDFLPEGDISENIIGGKFVFKWANGTVTIDIISGTADDSGTQVPVHPPGMDATTYSSVLVQYFKLNYTLNDLYEITQVYDYVHFVARNVGTEYDLANSQVFDTGYSMDRPSSPGDVVVQDNYKMFIDVFIESEHNLEDYEKIGTQELDPVDSICIFDISRIVNAYLEYKLPNPGTIIPFENKSSIKKFFIRYAEKYGNPVLPKKVYETTPTEALKSGLTYQQYEFITDAIQYIYIDESLFLTRQPRTKKVNSAQAEFLSWIAPAPDPYFAAHTLAPVVTIETVIYFLDGSPAYTKHSANIAVNERELWVLPVSYNALGISTLGAAYAFDKLLKYTVSVKWSMPGLPAVSETFTFICDQSFYIDQRIFLFTNSDGGIDTFRATGNKINESDVERDTLNIKRQYGYKSSTGEYTEANIVKTQKVKQNTGVINRDQLKWLDDFFHAEKKWEIMPDNSFLPIILTSTAKPFDESQAKPFSFDFEYFYAIDDNVIKSNELL